MKIGSSSGFCTHGFGVTRACRTLGRNLQLEAFDMVTQLTLQDSLNVPWRTSRASCLHFFFKWFPAIEGIWGYPKARNVGSITTISLLPGPHDMGKGYQAPIVLRA